MDNYDYKTIRVPKGAEGEFHKIFQNFGYRILVATDSTSIPLSERNNRNLSKFYYPGEADEDLLGLSLHTKEEEPLEVVTLTYGRNRKDQNFPSYLKAEHVYNHLTYDNYLLYVKRNKAQKKRFLPFFWNFILGALLVLGLGGFILSLCLGKVMVNEENYRAIDKLFSDPLSPWALIFYFSLLALLISLLCFLIFGIGTRVINGAKANRYTSAMNEIEGMKQKFRNDFRYKETVPTVDVDRLKYLEKLNILD